MSRSASVPVSVVIPAHNAASWLPRSVASVLEDGVDEIVIVDDGSTDDTARVALDLADSLRCVTFHACRVNMGAAAARRQAVALARNDWIAPLDSDDYVGPHAVSAAFRQAQIDMADICIWTLYRVRNGVPTAWPNLSAHTFPMSGRQAARLTLGSWRIHAAGVVRKETFLRAASSVKVESFNSDELVTRNLFLNSRVVTASTAGYYYVDNPLSTTRANPQDVAASARSHAWLLQFARENGFLAEDPALAHYMVRTGLDISERLARTSTEDSLVCLLDLLTECNPPMWQIGPRELAHELRSGGSRQRIRALKYQLRTPE